MNELKELDEIENLCERIYNSGSDDNSYRFNECVEGIMQLITTYTTKKELEARIDEIRNIPWKESKRYGINNPYITKQWYLDRITQLSSQLTNNKEGIENE